MKSSNKESCAKWWAKLKADPERHQRHLAMRKRYYSSKLNKSHIIRRHNLLRYDLTPEEYDTKLKEQNGVCAICGKPPIKRRLAVDHNHTTGTNRGLLCIKCNPAVGLVDENIETLQKMIEYLKKWESS